MARKKDIKIILDTYGNYLGVRKGCIVLSDKNKNETKYPLARAGGDYTSFLLKIR